MLKNLCVSVYEREGEEERETSNVKHLYVVS